MKSLAQASPTQIAILPSGSLSLLLPSALRSRLFAKPEATQGLLFLLFQLRAAFLSSVSKTKIIWRRKKDVLRAEIETSMQHVERLMAELQPKLRRRHNYRDEICFTPGWGGLASFGKTSNISAQAVPYAAVPGEIKKSEQTDTSLHK